MKISDTVLDKIMKIKNGDITMEAFNNADSKLPFNASFHVYYNKDIEPGSQEMTELRQKLDSLQLAYRVLSSIHMINIDDDLRNTAGKIARAIELPEITHAGVGMSSRGFRGAAGEGHSR